MKQKLQFRVGGAHIDVTTLQRNAYLFWKSSDLPCKTLRLFAKSQNWPLGFPLVWEATCINFLWKIKVFNLNWPDLGWCDVMCDVWCVMCACVHVCMCACVHLRMCACEHVCMCACVHVCMCACVHVCMCACVHVCMRNVCNVCKCGVTHHIISHVCMWYDMMLCVMYDVMWCDLMWCDVRCMAFPVHVWDVRCDV